MIIKSSKPREQVVLSVNVSDLGDAFLLASWMMETKFVSQWCF